MALISLPLKSGDRTIACPEVDRCSLEVIKNPRGNQIEVEDGVVYYRKVVKIGMQQPNRGCDVQVRVGLITQDGLVAHGQERIRRTDTVVVRTNTVSGEHISTTSSTSSELVSYDVPESEETTTTSYTEGFDTVTTTVTVTVFARKWERFMGTCQEARDIGLPATPHHLTSVQYYASTGEKVVLTQLLAENGDRHIQVDRQFGQQLRLSYSPSSDSLVVSAALSQNLRSLFVVISRLSSGSYEAVWEWHTFSPSTQSWVSYRAGTVPLPAGYTTNTRPSHVDRSGDVVGFFAAVQNTEVADQGIIGGPRCGGDGNGQEWNNLAGTYGEIYGGAWNIVTGAYTQGNYRTAGQALAGNDLGLTREALTTTTWYQQTDTYEWEAYTEGDDIGQALIHATRARYTSMDTGNRYNLAIGSITNLAETWDSGQKRLFAGNGYYRLVRKSNTPAPAGTCELTQYQEASSYIHEDPGSRLASVTPGGWISYRKVSIEKVGSTPYVESTTSERSCDMYTPACPNFADWYFGSGSVGTETAVDESETIYPVNLGAGNLTGRTFTAVDSEGSWYAGAEVITDGEPGYWRVFRNGGEITGAVETCIGRPIEQMAAMYWRV